MNIAPDAPAGRPASAIVTPGPTARSASARRARLHLVGRVRPSPVFTTPAHADPVAARLQLNAEILLWQSRIRFAVPEYGVAPGQAAVVYAGERVVGGGWIEATEPALIAA